jgi:hypothetical protein
MTCSLITAMILIMAVARFDDRKAIFTAYNKQTHTIFNTLLYLNVPTRFGASMHHLKGVLLLYHSYTHSTYIFKIIDTKQARIIESHENVKLKIQTEKANMWFNTTE